MVEPRASERVDFEDLIRQYYDTVNLLQDQGRSSGLHTCVCRKWDTCDSDVHTHLNVSTHPLSTHIHTLVLMSQIIHLLHRPWLCDSQLIRTNWSYTMHCFMSRRKQILLGRKLRFFFFRFLMRQMCKNVCQRRAKFVQKDNFLIVIFMLYLSTN